jgi:hypothetical protein
MPAAPWCILAQGLVPEQHRVKNNFQIILASIAIQKRRYPAGDAQRALDHIASRINAISLAHDQLTPREEGQVVNLSDYLRALCLSIKQQAGGRGRGMGNGRWRMHHRRRRVGHGRGRMHHRRRDGTRRWCNRRVGRRRSPDG